MRNNNFPHAGFGPGAGFPGPFGRGHRGPAGFGPFGPGAGFGPDSVPFGPSAGFVPGSFGPGAAFGPFGGKKLKKSDIRILKRLRKLAFTLLKSRDSATKEQREQVLAKLDQTIVDLKQILGAKDSAEDEDVETGGAVL